MNHIYKTIWNKSKQMFVVASEIASTKGKTSSEKGTVAEVASTKGRVFIATLTALSSMLYLQNVIAQTVVESGSTLVHNANNGVQVIDIAAANQAGISHNRYVKYNVDQKGQILNNAVMDPNNLSVMTSLAGKIHTNANLKESARLILNEVTGTQRSTLNGYIEVAGQKADVIIANPFGITCSGCGFINTDYSVLTTGKPNIDIDGKLKSFDVIQGDIKVTGLGLDASQQPVLKLISRNLYLDGQINAQDLSVITGTNLYDFETGSVEKTTSDVAGHAYAIDSTQLGGIYANKISLLATEQGVGVRMAGDAAANTDEFELTSAGTIELKNQISAKKDINIQNYSTEENLLKIEGRKNDSGIEGGLSGQNIKIGNQDNQSFKLEISNSDIFAEEGLVLNVNSLQSQSSTLQAKQEIDVNANKNVNLDATNIKSNKKIDILADSLSTFNKTSFGTQESLKLTTQKDIALGDETHLIAQDKIEVESLSGNISVDDAQIASNKNIEITAENGNIAVEKANIQTLANLNVTAQSIALDAKTNAQNTSLKVSENINLNKYSEITSQYLTDLDAKNITILGKSIANEMLINAKDTYSSGDNSKVLAQDKLELKAKNAEINGLLGANNLNVTSLEHLNQSGEVFAQETYNLTADSANLTGKNSAKNLNIKTSSALNQQIGSLISVAENLTVNAKNYDNKGYIIADNIIASVTDRFTQEGYFAAINKIALTTTDAVLHGDTEAYDINILANNDFTNTGTLLADNLLDINANNVVLDGNEKTAIAAKTLDIKARDIEQKKGSLIQASELLKLRTTNNLELSGTIQAQKAKINSDNQLTLANLSNLKVNSSLDINAKNIDSRGNILARNVGLNATQSVQTLGQTQALENLKVTAQSAVLAGDLFADNATIAIQENLDQNGGIYISDKLDVNAKNINQNGLIFSNNADLHAIESLKQADIAQLVSDQNITLRANDINLKGIVSAKTFNVSDTKNLILNGQAEIKGLTTLKADKIKLDGLLVTQGASITGTDQIEQTEGDILSSSGNLTLTSDLLDLSGQSIASQAILTGRNGIESHGSIQAYGDITLNSDQDITLFETSRTIAQGNINLDAKHNFHAKASNALKSQISSNADVMIKAGNNAALDGSVVARNITTTADQQLNTGNSSYIKAIDQLSLSSTNQSISLLGKSYGNKQNIKAKKQIKVSQDASVEAAETLEIVANDLINDGTIRNAGTTEFDLVNVKNTGSLLSNKFVQSNNDILDHSFNKLDNTGLFLSNLDFSLTAQKIVNTGNIIGNSKLDLQTHEFENTGSISAVSNIDLGITVNDVENNGIISAGGELKVNANDLMNNQILQANTVNLNVSSLINKKDILASDEIKITSTGNVRNKGEIYADQKIKIDAEKSNVINENMIYTNTTKPSEIEIIASSVLNNKQDVGNTTINGLILTNGLFLKSDTIDNNSKIISSHASINETDGQKIAKLNNNKSSTFAIIGSESKKASNLNANIQNNSDATFYLSNSGEVDIKGIFTNEGLLYLSNDSDLIIKNLINKSDVVVDHSIINVTDKYTHTANIEAYNQANLNFSNLDNNSSLILENSILNVNQTLNNNGIINASGESYIKSDILNNNNLIYGSKDLSQIYIDANKINIKEKSGLLSLGSLYLNTLQVNQNSVQNLGNIFAKDYLSIGTEVTDFSNLVSADRTLSGETNLAYGGVVSSDGNIDFNVNNFTNNYQINSSGLNKNININVDGKFTNETVYYGDKLVLDYIWKSPTFQKIAPNRDQRDTISYDNGNVKYQQVANAGSGDGVDAVLVTEKWYLSTVYNNGLSYGVLAPYLSETNNIAQIRSNDGDILININSKNDDAKNYGGKIVAGNNIVINAPHVNFSNETINLFEDKLYNLEYVLLSDKSDRHVLAYRLDSDNKIKLVFGDIDEDGQYERTNNYIDELEDYYKGKFDTYYGSNAQENLRNFLRKNPINFRPFQKTSQTKNNLDAQAVISAGGFLKIETNTLSNDSNTSSNKALVGETAQKSYTDTNIPIIDRPTCDSLSPSCQQTKKTEVDEPSTTSGKDAIPEPKGESLGAVDNKVDLDSVTEAETSDVEKSEKIEGEKDVAPVLPKLPGSREIHNDYPMDKIPTVNITLPSATDPYGKYVQSKDPNSEFLVESNPLYGQSADVIGANYLRDQLGIVPDATLKRLGDSRYEQELVRQQLEQVTGKGTISDKKMEQYFNNAIEMSNDLGLTYGKALTSDQIKQLDKDIVWMVEQVVNGQRVLVPQVYLSYTTLQNIDNSGSVLEGEEGVYLDVDSLENNESTVKGGTVVVDAKNDINNIGATIKGRDVQLTSTQGSINNITVAHNYGDDFSGSTYIGSTAGIISENNLVLDAAKDINITGAKVKAGGTAVFEAGNDINITTIQDKRATTTGSGKTMTTVASTTHIGSQIDIGGNAILKSENDTLISGSEFNVGGSLAAQTGGDFKLVSVQDTVETTTKSSKSGVGVGGGVWGTKTTETNEFVGTNKASTLNVGGVVDIESANKVVIEGSDLNIASDGVSRIHGTKGVDILDGKDEYRKETTTTTTSFLKLESSGGSSAGSNAGAAANASGYAAQAGAAAGAEAGAEKSASLKLMEQTVTKQKDTETKSVSSNVNSNGSLLISSDEGAVHVVGSSVDVKGALVVDAKNIIVEAGKNEKTSTTQSNSQSIGIYNESSAGASANANAGAAASLHGAYAGTEVGAQAGASSTTTFGAMSESSSSYSKEVTNNLSSLKGGTVSLTAEETARFEGADVRSEGAMRIKAADIQNIAVQDTYESHSSSSSTLAGVYLGAEAKVSASASAGTDANVFGASAGANASVEANAEVSAGLRTNNKSSTEDYSKTTNIGNNFVSGGDFERIADNSIIDEVTSVTSGGTIYQSAQNVYDFAKQDTETYSKKTNEQEARLGVYAGVGAGASAEATASTNLIGSAAGTGTKVDKPEASAGLQASYSSSGSTEGFASSQAATSKFKANAIESNVSGHMELNGTVLDAKETVSLNAGSMNYNQVTNTYSESSTNNSTDIGGKVGLVGTPSAEANLDISSSVQSNTSKVGQGGAINAKNVTVNVDGALNSQGLTITSESKPTVKAENQTHKAATNESSSSETSSNIGFGISSSGVKFNAEKNGVGINTDSSDQGSSIGIKY